MSVEADKPDSAQRFIWKMERDFGLGMMDGSPLFLFVVFGIFFCLVTGFVTSLGAIGSRTAKILITCYVAAAAGHLLYRRARIWRWYPHLARFKAVRAWNRGGGATARLQEALLARSRVIGEALGAGEAFLDFMNRYDFFVEKSSWSDERKNDVEARLAKGREGFLKRLELLRVRNSPDWNRLVGLQPMSDAFLRKGLDFSAVSEYETRRFCHDFVPHLECWIATAKGWSDEKICRRLSSARVEKKFAAWVETPSIARDAGSAASEDAWRSAPSPLAESLEAPLKQHHHDAIVIYVPGFVIIAVMVALGQKQALPYSFAWLEGLLFSYVLIAFGGLSSPYTGTARRGDLPWILLWYGCAIGGLLLPLAALSWIFVR